MSNYKTGRIYKIICIKSDDVYIGSTFNTIRDRFSNHKAHYKRWLDGKHHKLSLYESFTKFGIDQFKMILIKEYQVCDRKHLEAYEALWISKLGCVNKIVPFRITNLTNKTNLKKKGMKSDCGCGGKYTYGSRTQHFKTKKHIKWQASQ